MVEYEYLAVKPAQFFGTVAISDARYGGLWPPTGAKHLAGLDELPQHGRFADPSMAISLLYSIGWVLTDSLDGNLTIACRKVG